MLEVQRRLAFLLKGVDPRHDMGPLLLVPVSPAPARVHDSVTAQEAADVRSADGYPGAERQVIAAIVLIRTRCCCPLIFPRVRSLTMRGRLDI
jgi:hypothetical protein